MITANLVNAFRRSVLRPTSRSVFPRSLPPLSNRLPSPRSMHQDHKPTKAESRLTQEPDHARKRNLPISSATDREIGQKHGPGASAPTSPVTDEAKQTPEGSTAAPFPQDPLPRTEKSQVDLIRESLQGHENSKWGFLIYRCTYADDAAWEKFMSHLKSNAHHNLQKETLVT